MTEDLLSPVASDSSTDEPALTQEESVSLGQQELPFARVQGQPYSQIPKDLYIPPDALEVFLEAFEGPLDLLLYLIRKQNLEIEHIPIADITLQYMQYVEMMKELHLELAAEYLVMAAMLAEIKSRVLLPRPESELDDEDDPRAELIRRLQEYERFKQAAQDIDSMPRVGRDTFLASVKIPDLDIEKPEPDVDLKELLFALSEVLERASMFTEHQIKREILSTREKMARVLERLSSEKFCSFVELFEPEEGKMGVVVTFLAVMELTKESLLEIIQNEPYGPIHVRAKS
jgi:segregation and condensation protein A